MNITNRIFTYPVLSEEKNDYKTGEFQVDFSSYMAGVNTLRLSFDILMNNKEIERLILEGKAEYVIHLECSTTAYREILKSISNHVEYELPIGRITGSFDVVAFVIAKKPIRGFFSEDWDEDFEGLTFDVSQGNILAYQNLPGLNIEKDFEEFTSANSIFSVYKRMTDEDKPAEVSLESDKIRIGLGTKDYDIYAKYANKNELQAIFHAMVVFPTLIFVFEELKQEGGYDQYHNRNWFVALEKAYEKRGLHFMEEVLNTDKSSVILAQEAMELPLSKAFAQIPLFYDMMEED